MLAGNSIVLAGRVGQSISSLRNPMTNRIMRPIPFRCQFSAALLATFLAIDATSIPKPVHAAEPAAKTVELTIDYGDGVQKRFLALQWRDGMTVMDAMQAAKKHKRGIDFQTVGEGEMAMLTTIDGQKNQGGGASDKNWVYQINGKYAHRSFGVKTLSAGDVVLWRFEVYDQ